MTVILYTSRGDVGTASRITGLDVAYTNMAGGLGLANEWGAPLTVAEAAAKLNVDAASIRSEGLRFGVELADDGAGTARPRRDRQGDARPHRDRQARPAHRGLPRRPADPGGGVVTDEQRAATRALRRYRDTADRYASAERAAIAALRDAVRDAHTAGVPIAHIAADAGVTRQTVYRWIRDDTP